MPLAPWPKQLKPLLLACRDTASVAKLHALAILTGLLGRPTSLSGQLIASYARAGSIEYARKVFDVMPDRSVDAWNAMIVAHSRNRAPAQVLNLYHRMVLEGGRPDSSTFTVAVKACATVSDLKLGVQIWSRAVGSGYERDVFVASSVLNLYAKCGRMDSAAVVFDKMPRRDLVCWTTMVTGYAQCGRAREALDVYKRMQQKVGTQGDEILMLGLIRACTDIGDMKVGLSVHGHMIRNSIPMDVVVQTCLVGMYAKNGCLEIASRVFNKIPNKTVVSWSTLILGFAQNGFAWNALELFTGMQRLGGLRPDSVSLVSALLACAQVGLLKFGRSIHGYIMRSSFDINEILGTAMLDMYSKCGELSHARALFDQFPSKDSILWNAMIASYGINGRGREALALFLQMRKVADLKQDGTTFGCLLSALSHSGLVSEGRHWCDVMVREYKIQLQEKHYACVVDLLARAGQLKEAWELIDSRANEPGIAVLVALLSGCCNYRDILVGEKVAKRVLELKPDDPAIYSLVSNFFAMARMWKEVAGVRKIMKDMVSRKVPGYSAVELNGTLRAFLMEDTSCHQYEEITWVLGKLYDDMRAMGHVPETEFELEELK